MLEKGILKGWNDGIMERYPKKRPLPYLSFHYFNIPFFQPFVG
jgi:hypothetical protein